FYDEFLSERKKSEAYERASDQIHATLDDVSGLMGNVKKATAGYSATLSGATKKISAVRTPEEMHHVLKDVVLDTQKMLEQNKQLEVQLDRSAIAIQEL